MSRPRFAGRVNGSLLSELDRTIAPTGLSVYDCVSRSRPRAQLRFGRHAKTAAGDILIEVSNLTTHQLLSLSLLATLPTLNGTAQGDDQPTQNRSPLKRLRRIYLMTHALNWLEITPGDPRRQTKEWEQWPGRCEVCYQYEFGLKEKYYRLMSAADERTGVFCLPSGMKGDVPLIELAKRTFGDRCVVCRLGYDQSANRLALGEAFAKGLEEDRQRAEAARGKNLSEGEIAAWERSKAWTLDLRTQLESRGYTFDPTKVGFIAFGEDWSGCAATFPIHMGRAFGLTKPIERRFDLINPDCTPVLLKATVIEQNLHMPNDIRLFLFKTNEGRFLGQYWEGMHGLFDRPHTVTVSFPPASARLVDMFGRPHGNQAYGQVSLGVGCGGHTPYRADLVQAEPTLSLSRFRKALLSGVVSQVPPG